MLRVRILLLVAFSLATVTLVIVFLCWPPRDLRLTAVTVVDGNDPKIAKDVGERNGKLAIVSFETNRDLSRFSQNGVYDGLFVELYLCRLGHTAQGTLVGYSLVYDQSGPVGIDPPKSDGAGRYGSSRNYGYRLYTNLQHAVSENGTHFDLLLQPEDLCFFLEPHLPLLGLWPPTNVVSISKVELADAIAQARNN